jgi:phosphoribosylanthranilate isomerase
MKPRIKICCISSVDDALTAVEFGASALGLVGKMPSGPGVIPDELILEIAKRIPPSIGTFLLTSETSTNNIIAHHHRTHTNTIQIVDELKTGNYVDFRTQLPSIKIVQVIHVLDTKSVETALQISERVDALLLDSGNPNLQIKQLGGTGLVHNWTLSRKIVEKSKVPVFLAGGLNADNVKEAMDKVNPFGLDVCSGVRTNKKLDPKKLEAFFNAAWS